MAKPKLIVVGDLLLDHYLWGTCERISPEAPVQIVDIQSQAVRLGGAGNVVNNLCEFGAHVVVIGVVGSDADAEQIKSMLVHSNVKAHIFTEPTRKTTKKTRIIASNQQVVRYDVESRNEINPETESAIISTFKKNLDKTDVVLLSDYGKGIFTEKLTQELIRLSNDAGVKVLIDPKGLDYSKYSNAYLLTPNKKEASLATGLVINSHNEIEQAIVALKKNFNLTASIITLSENGIALYDKDFTIISATSLEVFDVTGAGDTVLAAIGYQLAIGSDLLYSVRFANLAAGVVVGKIGSATASLEEIFEHESQLKTHKLYKKIKSLEQIENICNSLREKNKKIVFTNGCFDLLHRGHVSYLNEAKMFGDVLIVGVNADSSVKRLKGNDRPINDQSDRALILSALECVDYVVIFHEDTPYDLIKAIGPDVLVKGGDYENKTIIGSDLAPEVKIIPFVKGKSTTTIIDVISKDGKDTK